MTTFTETHNAAVQLEQVVDKLGLDGTLAVLATICGEKAEHIRENWQDNVTARSWVAAGRRLDKVAHAIAELLR